MKILTNSSLILLNYYTMAYVKVNLHVVMFYVLCWIQAVWNCFTKYALLVIV